MIVKSIDKIELDYKYMITNSPDVVVRIFYNGSAKLETSILSHGISTQLLQLMYATYVIFDTTNLQDVFYEIVDRMHCVTTKENFRLFSIQIATQTVDDVEHKFRCANYKDLQENLDLDWNSIDVARLKSYKINHVYLV